MSAGCGHHHEHHDVAPKAGADAGYRRVLFAALVVNAAMFAVELGVGIDAGSKSLLADAIDFLGDAANYGLSLFVLGLALAWRARAALLKGAAMIAFGLSIIGSTVHAALYGALPHAGAMGVVGVFALAANVGVALLLYRHRSGDSNRRAVWLCTRNDAIGNLAVLAAAGGVFASDTAWPDLAVAAGMAGLAVSSGVHVVRLAVREIASARMASVGTAPLVER